MVTTLSTREFDRDVSSAKRATEHGPVLIVDHGKPSHVLLSFDDYRRLNGDRRNIAEALASSGGEDIEFEASPAAIRALPAEFT